LYLPASAPLYLSRYENFKNQYLTRTGRKKLATETRKGRNTEEKKNTMVKAKARVKVVVKFGLDLSLNPCITFLFLFRLHEHFLYFYNFYVSAVAILNIG
jgi:hypothetical protein